MGLFKKKINFVSAKCPECNGNLELDTEFKVAFCNRCGAQCIVENAPRVKEKTSKLSKVLDFMERQQSIRRQDKKERERKAEEKEKKRENIIKKYWWIYAVILASLFALVITMAILENQGIV